MPRKDKTPERAHYEELLGVRSLLEERAPKEVMAGARGSGRTHNMLVQVLSEAQQGKTCYVLATSYMHARQMMHHLTSLPQFGSLGPNAHVNLTSCDIQLPTPMGQIRFRPEKDHYDWLAGDMVRYGLPRGVPVHIDHYTWEQKIRELGASIHEARIKADKSERG